MMSKDQWVILTCIFLGLADIGFLLWLITKELKNSAGGSSYDTIRTGAAVTGMFLK